MTSIDNHKSLFTAAAVLALGIGVIGCGAQVSSEDTAATTDPLSANEKTAYEFFVGKGLKNFQSAGIVGNLIQESNVDPTITQIGGGPGRGIAQWSVGGRWDTTHDDNAEFFASKEHESVESLTLQLQFVWYELSTFPTYGLSELKSSGDVSEATIDFQDRFEGCGECDQSNRISDAEAVLSAFGGSSSTSCTVENVEGVCIEKSACAAKAGHVSTPGFCPGAADVECCTAPPTCKVDGVAGLCIETSVCASMSGHHSTPGFCPGSSTEECCTP